jgi:hypothetical protein
LDSVRNGVFVKLWDKLLEFAENLTKQVNKMREPSFRQYTGLSLRRGEMRVGGNNIRTKNEPSRAHDGRMPVSPVRPARIIPAGTSD